MFKLKPERLFFLLFFACYFSSYGSDHKPDKSSFALAVTINAGMYNGADVSCNGATDGTAQAVPAGGTAPYSYSWSDGQTTQTALNLPPGTYTVTVTDATTTATASITLVEPSAISASAPTTDVSCMGGTDGEINATASGGTAPYEYTDGTTTNTDGEFTGLSAGSYTISVSDANGCNLFPAIDVTIGEPSTALSISLDASTDESCNGADDGTAMLSATGGTSPYTFDINAVTNMTGSFTGLEANTYTAMVTDDQGCVETVSVIIAEPTVITETTSSTNVLCNGADDGTITVAASGGTAPYEYTDGTTTNTDGMFTGLAPGTYDITITDDNGCPLTVATQTITEPAAAVAISLDGSTDESCNVADDGTATLSASGGTGPYDFEVNSVIINNPSTASFSGLSAAGSPYTAMVTDAQGCIATVLVPIEEPAAITETTSSTNVSCNGANDGEITVTASGGVSPYTYTDGTDTNTDGMFTDLAPGFYDITISDDDGCTLAVATQEITEPAALVATGTPTMNISCFGGSNGVADVSAVGGTAPYTYLWSDGKTTATASALAAGTYMVTVTDANDCTDVATVSLTQPASALGLSVVETTPVSCNGVSDGVATATASGGTAAYTYTWSDGQTTAAASGLAAGTYTVTLVDMNGCQKIESVDITQPSAIVPSAVVDMDVSCNGGNDGQATASASGGTAASGYTYLWNDAGTQGTAVATGLLEGTYMVVITDDNSCMATASVTIAEPTMPLVAPTSVSSDYNGADISCFGDSDGEATAAPTGGTAPYSYAWSDASSQTTAVATGLVAGTYMVTVTDDKGCMLTESVTLTDPVQLTATAAVDMNVSCNGGDDGAATVTGVDGTGSYTYLWSDGQTTATASGLVAGSYDVTVTDDNDCEATVIGVAISEPGTAVSATVSVTSSYSGEDIRCNGGSDGEATVSASGGTVVGTGYTYLWSDGQTTAIASGLSEGTYYVTVTDSNGCEVTESVTLTEPTVLVPSASVSSPITCVGAADGAATASSSGGVPPYNYEWDSAAAGQTTATATGLATGTYEVTVTDGNGCTESTTITIDDPTSLVPTASVATNYNGADLTCNGATDGAITATAVGGAGSYTYQWDAAAGSSTNATVSGLGAGDYSVAVTDANGCVETASVTIVPPVVLDASALETSAVSCNGESDGEATASATGGTAPYSYLWDDALVQTTAVATGLAAGTYNVTITDANGCTDNTIVTVTEPTVLTASATNSMDVTCNGGSDGEATATPTGGTASYSYLWDDALGQTTAVATGLAAGTYMVVVTDDNGCSTTASAIIGEPTAVAITVVSQSDVTCNGGTDGAIDVSVADGTPSYSYAWSDGVAFTSTSEDLTALAAGIYELVVTDGAGCVATTSVTINEPTALSASAVETTGVSCNGDSDGVATATVSGGTAASGYTYLWDAAAGSQTTAMASGLAAGTYTVMITDDNGCNTTATATIGEPAALTGTTTSIDATCNGESDGVATAIASGGTAASGYIYLWDTAAGSQTTAMASGLAAGTYTVVIIDDNACNTTATATIGEPAALTATATSMDATCNGGSDGVATATASGGTAASGYTYLWDAAAGSQTTAMATGLAAGTYTVMISDDNACNTTATATIGEPTAVAITVVSQSNVSCNGVMNGTIGVSVSGGTGAYSYNWSDGAGFSSTNEDLAVLSGGTYMLTVTDGSACTATTSVTITEPAVLSASAVETTAVSCNGASDGEATASATGGTAPYSYLWDGAAGGQTTVTATDLAAGTYMVTITDSNGCIADASVTVSEPNALAASAVETTAVICNGLSVGVATASATGGTAPYTYAWSDGQTTAVATGLAAGTYTVIISDANGCTDNASATVTEPTALTAAAANLSDATCNGGNDGEATASATGGTAPYTYVWDAAAGGQTTAMVSSLAAGTYTVTATDANDCMATASVTISEPSALVASTSITIAVSCHGGSNGQATVTASGGTAPYTYAWNDPLSQTTASASGLLAGTYMVEVTDVNGCTATSTATVTQPNMITATTLVTDPSCDGETDGSVTVTASNTVAPYTFMWNDPTGQTSTVATGLGAGSYIVTITDANGCTTSLSATVSDPGVACSTCPANYAGLDKLTGIQSVAADYETDGIIESEQLINNNTQVDYDAADCILLLPGFEVELGVEFDAFIDGCDNGGGGNQ